MSYSRHGRESERVRELLGVEGVMEHSVSFYFLAL